MCGILGSLPAIPEPGFRRALDLLRHRGPDGEDVWTAEDRSVILGHRRLAIFDLSDEGNQPMQEGPFTIVFNGEIYNFPELRADLRAKGYAFHSNTDTEVILKGFAAWGPEVFAKLNGMWAIAIWDSRDRSLLLSRDRFGQKPLYFHQEGERFVFASEMKAIIPFLKEVKISSEFSWLRDNLFHYEPTSKCLIKGIDRFPAGHWGKWKNGKLELHQYWNTLDHLQEVPQSYEEQVEAFRELFLDAVGLRMRSDVSLGTALSGGVDSSSTMAGMAWVAGNANDEKVNTDWKHAFVASMPGTALDETKYAKQVSAHLGIDPQIIRIDPVKGLEELPRWLYLFEELYITSPVPMMQTYSFAGEKGIHVTIDGHGADELFSGYDTFLFQAFRDCGFKPSAIRNILDTYSNLAGPHPQFKKPDYDFTEYLQANFGNRKWASLWKYRKEELAKKKQFLPDLANGRKVSSIDELGCFNSGLYKMFHHDNLPTLLRNYDRYSMAFGVEIRMPFLDHRLVSYSFSLPWTSKLRNGYTKTILRDAMAPFLPEEVIYRKWKMGFQTPIVEWLKGPWKEWALDLMASDAFHQSSLHDSATVKEKMTAVIQNEHVSYRDGEQAFAAFSTFLWEYYVLSRFKGMERVIDL